MASRQDTSTKMAETSKTIDWIRKKGKGAVERGVEVLIEIGRKLKRKIIGYRKRNERRWWN